MRTQNSLRLLLSVLLISFVVSSCSHKAPLNRKSREALKMALKKHRIGEMVESRVSYRQLCTHGVRAGCVLGYPKKRLRDFESLGLSKSRKNVGAMQSATTENSTVISLIEPYRSSRRYYFIERAQGEILDSALIQKDIHTFKKSPWALREFILKHLEPGKKYRLVVLGEDMQLIDARDFSPLRMNGKKLRFSALSCMSDQIKESDRRQMWEKVRQRDSDVLLMIGDNVYADMLDGGEEVDEVTPDQLWLRHIQMRQRLGVYQWDELTPIFAVWDDHDYGYNNGGKNYTYREESTKIFHRFFPQRELFKETSRLKSGPGISYKLKLRNQNFYFLDGRTFRDADKKLWGHHLGKAQTRWLMSNLEKDQDFSWLIMGDQFFGAHHPFESFEGQHPKTFAKFLSSLKKRSSTPILFLSGDRHFSQTMEVPKALTGRKTYQFTSSPVHSSVYPGSLKENPNPHQISGVDGKYSFLYFVSAATKKQLALDVRAIGLANKPYFRNVLDVER